MRKSVWMCVVALLACSGSFARAECGASTRSQIDSVKCDDIARDTWYELVVNKMCGTHSGEEQTVVEIVEKRPNISNTQGHVWAKKMAHEIYKNKNTEWKLFDQRTGKKGLVEAFAKPSADNKRVESLRLHIKPEAGEECTKVVTLPEAVWKEFGKTASAK